MYKIILLFIIIFILLLLFLKTNAYSICENVNKLLFKYSKTNDVYYSTNSVWMFDLRNNYNIIYDEYLEYSNKHTIISFKDIDDTQRFIDESNIPWPVIILRAYNKDTDKINYFNKTYELIKSIPGCTTAMFSILPPYKKIPRHNGIYKGVLRYHLALSTPINNEDCFIVVNKKKYSWKTGEDVMFDDTYEHYVQNNTDQYRVVLFLDIKKNFDNIFLDCINSIILYFVQFNDTVKTIVQNVNDN